MCTRIENITLLFDTDTFAPRRIKHYTIMATFFIPYGMSRLRYAEAYHPKELQ